LNFNAIFGNVTLAFRPKPTHLNCPPRISTYIYVCIYVDVDVCAVISATHVSNEKSILLQTQFTYGHKHVYKDVNSWLTF